MSLPSRVEPLMPWMQDLHAFPSTGRLTVRSVVAATLLVITMAGSGLGQSGLRESLERLDVDDNGSIDPDEITPLARPYLERIAPSRRLSLNKSNRIEAFQEAARIYYAVNNGVSGADVEPSMNNTIQPFRPDDTQPLVPEFGLSQVKYPYTQEDLDDADRALRRSDRNDDGQIDRREAERSQWTHRDPFEMDLDQNGKLSRLELAQRYARRRLLSAASDELVRKARRVGSGIRPVTSEERPREDRSRWWREGGSRYYLTASVLGRFDRNKNGRLDASEVTELGIPAGLIDVDRDGQLSRDELQAFLVEKQDEAGDSAEGLPGWFYELDLNRDGQVEMAEFAQDWSVATLSEFRRLDRNEDGLLTGGEVATSRAVMGGSFNNTSAEILPPHKTIISEIEIEDDFIIGDLNLELSITHSHVEYLDGYLTGPDGQRIELFTGIGGSGDHFSETRFDDQSRYPITKARPPYSGTFLPEGVVKKQPGLGHFNGQSAAGVWQLVIRATRSDRFGMLHGWSLMFRPEEEMVGSAAAPQSDGPRPPGDSDRSRPAHLPNRSDSTADRLGADDRARAVSQSPALPKSSAAMADKSWMKFDAEAARAKAEAFAKLSEEEKAEKIAKYREWIAAQKEAKAKGRQDPATLRKMDRSGKSERAGVDNRK